MTEAKEEVKIIMEAQSRILSNANIVTIFGLAIGSISQSDSLQALLSRSGDAVDLVIRRGWLPGELVVSNFYCPMYGIDHPG